MAVQNPLDRVTHEAGLLVARQQAFGSRGRAKISLTFSDTAFTSILPAADGPKISMTSPENSQLCTAAMGIELRSANAHDFDYCRRVYFAEMKWIIKELRLNMVWQEANFREQWKAAQVRIITLEGSDVGWLQTFIEDDALLLAQLFIDRPFQRRGIGTQVIHRLIDEGDLANQPLRLNVVKINPAVRLYGRLGFLVIREDERKFYMKRDPETTKKASP